MRLRYVLYMLSVAVLHLLAFTSFVAITGKFGALTLAVPMNLIDLVAVNAIGALVLFHPIQRYLAGEATLASAIPRIRWLPVLSAAWGAVLVVVLMSVAFFGFNALCPNCDPLAMAPLHLSMIALFASFIALFLYFAIGDYTAQLKDHIFETTGELVPPTGARLMRKFVAAFVAVGVVPVALAFLEVFAFADARAAQGMTTTQAFLFDLVIIVLMAAAAFYFIQRSLRRPVDSLMDAMKRFGAGRMETKAAILTDDEIGVMAAGFNDMVEAVRERDFLRETFGKYVPEQVAADILASRGEFVPQHRLATILYADIQDFTKICESLDPTGVVRLLNEYFSLIVPIIEGHGGVVNQFQGDAMLVTFNVPVADENHARDAVRAALAVQGALECHDFPGATKMITRIGVNTGEVVAGAVGAGDRLSYTVHGDAVNLAARLEALNKQCGTRVLISEFTRDLAGDEFVYEAMGDAPIRGRSEPVQVYTVREADLSSPPSSP